MKPIIKIFGRMIISTNVMFYNLVRYFKYSGLSGNCHDGEIRNYHLVKIYHALEKSMSYKERNSSRGWSTARLLLCELEKSSDLSNKAFHDHKAIVTLVNFLNFEGNSDRPEARVIRERLEVLEKSFAEQPGSRSVRFYDIRDFEKGRLEAPEEFFLSRYSLREFRDKPVEAELVERALRLAVKTPSVCNRQPWSIYYSSDKKVIQEALKYQAGNVGFGHSVPNLMIVCADLKGFMAGNEAYQYWIDGGLISMSVVYALHSLGIASCCLNWSQYPKIDKQIRRKLNISDNHTIIMMLAYGWPEDKNIVCESSRRPVESIMKRLELK